MAAREQGTDQMSDRPKIAVIGAGLAGMRLTQRLGDAATVTVFEKSRGIGGRMSTRRAGERRFDHGAQYFTARGSSFRDFLTPFIAGGTVAVWKPRLMNDVARDAAGPTGEDDAGDTRYVACPGMNSLCKLMGEAADVALATRVATISRDGATWSLKTTDDASYAGFDYVLCTAPSVQTKDLMPAEFAGHEALAQVKMAGCYSLMLGFDAPPALSWDAAFVKDGPLSWIAANHSKPARSGAEMLCQSDNVWADENIERDQNEVRETLMAAFTEITGTDAQQADYASLHRWRYAKMTTPADAPCLFDAARGLGAAGDWCGGGRVESAFDSGDALADVVLQDMR